MLFVITAMDKPGALDLRLTNRAAHFEYVKATGMVRLGGPYLDDSGAMIGSLIILDAADLAAAKAWAQNDPYAKAGLFQSTAITPWKATANFCGAAL
ncbi:MAG: YciI family protein [Alphaproteobacteria bacterium]|nr:YciI family protein [Alphaproteobacteria bacterium]MBU6472632.1 YciI family protein [Alphaproteobacteria bacterium]MDE2014087.1 YciI family protein [Alphaproteobacteria bacterium]MDE2072226.1 YciI family protein [Alphaproteobacteria bacterium]MDE2350681.1 YciI family protein [Alphaproteobacteria bacterium]